ncbi:MAG: glucose 1-dehydrogenase [Pseudomonadota bacterium]
MSQSNPQRFSSKIAMVTGASRGIGAAVASQLAAEGAHVVLVSRDKDSLAEVAASISEHGGQATVMSCHVGRVEAIDQLMGQVEQELGRLDCLVNNAGTNPYFGMAGDAEEWAFDKTFAVNLKGPYFLSARAVKLMAKNGGGSIVNVASIEGLQPARQHLLYAMSKAAMINMSVGFAKEYGPDGIRVNTVCPGVVETRLAKALTENPQVQKMLKYTPAGRHAQPEEMVEGILYLLSDGASYTTATTLTMDGGTLTNAF